MHDYFINNTSIIARKYRITVIFTLTVQRLLKVTNVEK